MTKSVHFDGKRAMLTGSILGGLGLLLCLLGAFTEPQRWAFAWLMAFTFTASIAMGALIFLMISYVINARWVVVIRRLTECVTLAFVPLAVFFVPLLLSARYLYPWVEPHTLHLSEHEVHLLHHKAAYLNMPFFTARAVFFFAVFLLCATLLRRWSLRRDGMALPDRDPFEAQSTFRVFSSAMLPLVALSLTFSAFDWLMSLEPFWYSAIYGVYVFAGGFLGAIAVLIILAWLGASSRQLPELSPHHFHALGRLLLAFTIFWAYAGFFQAMLIKIANKAEEVGFYLRRIEGSWLFVVWVLIIGHFALPFLFLLLKRVKFSPRVMAAVSVWMLVMHAVDSYWLVLPVLHPRGVSFHWLDLAALLAIVGTTAGFVAWRQHQKPLLTSGDPFLPSAIGYGSH